MTINVGAALKNFHTNPTDVCRACLTFHMVATFGLLDRAPTLGAISCIVLFLPLGEGVIAQYGLFVLLAGQAFVADSAAFGADRSQTRGTGEGFAVVRDRVDLIAVRCGTVLVVGWVRADVLRECIVEQFV